MFTVLGEPRVEVPTSFLYGHASSLVRELACGCLKGLSGGGRGKVTAPQTDIPFMINGRVIERIRVRRVDALQQYAAAHGQ